MKVYGVIGGAAGGGSGLTGRLLAEIAGRGVTVSAIRRADDEFDVDHPGKDSHRHRIAGAREVLLASRNRVALMQELRGETEPPLHRLLARLDPVDLVLVEGYDSETHAKVEAHSAAAGTAPAAPGDPTVRAVASDTDLTIDRPVFDLGDTRAIADFILREVGL